MEYQTTSNICHIRDFLNIYNQLSEHCFKPCVGDMNPRQLLPHEIRCLEHCTEKFAKLNRRFMYLYQRYQQDKVESRLNHIIEDSNVENPKEAKTDIPENPPP